jgi:hypothetical protein
MKMTYDILHKLRLFHLKDDAGILRGLPSSAPCSRALFPGMPASAGTYLLISMMQRTYSNIKT